mmetsp:Transcript_65220/g.189066  ORF Transcript_65220/g.189066 Transcript_65220/m.189066 type:complete len:274 (-) Transcript_65220:69-890(-)
MPNLAASNGTAPLIASISERRRAKWSCNMEGLAARTVNPNARTYASTSSKDKGIPLFRATASASRAHARATDHAAGSSCTSPTVMPVSVQEPLYVQLQMNFSQIILLISAHAWTLKPAAAQASATRRSLAVSPPTISPRQMRFMLRCSACPGPFIEAPKLLAIPSITRSGLTCLAMRSPAPSPFWMVKITPSAFTSFAAASAAAPTPDALVATTTRSTVPAAISEASPVACSRTVRSPLAPSTRSPLARIASTCSLQMSTAQTSFPAEASKPA